MTFRRTDTYLIPSCYAAKAVNRLSSAGIYIVAVQTAAGKARITAYYKDRNIIIAILNKLCYNYRVISRSGRRGKNPVAAYRGVIAGLMLAVAFTAPMRFVLLDVKVNSSAVDGKEIVRVLAENGVREGSFVFALDKDRLEAAVQAIDGVAFADIERKGTSLIVTVMEELPDEDIYYLSSDTEIKAHADAVVSRQLIYSGTSLVADGQAVKEGQTIVGGYYEVGEERVTVPARAEIYGLVYYSGKFVFDKNLTELVYTGREKRTVSVEFLGLKSPLTASPYDKYTTHTSFSRSGWLLPLKVTATVYREMAVKTTDAVLSRQAAADRALNEVRESLAPGALVKREWFTVDTVDNSYVVEAFIEAEQRIG